MSDNAPTDSREERNQTIQCLRKAIFIYQALEKSRGLPPIFQAKPEPELELEPQPRQKILRPIVNTSKLQMPLVLPVRENLNGNRIEKKGCGFCKSNGEPKYFYSSHVLKEGGKVVCPVLSKYNCPICKMGGIFAHTIKYCQVAKDIITPSITSMKTPKMANGKPRK